MSMIFQLIHLISFTFYAHPVKLYTSFSGMALAIFELKILDAELQIANGGVESFVAEQFLDVAERHPLLDEVRGEGVAQAVRGDAFFEAGEIG